MAASFDINSRGTLAWIDGGVPSKSWARNGSNYVLNPEDRHSFYEITGDRLTLHQCPQASADTSQVFNPMIGVADWPTSVREADVYDWAVRSGLVTDQR